MIVNSSLLTVTLSTGFCKKHNDKTVEWCKTYPAHLQIQLGILFQKTSDPPHQNFYHMTLRVTSCLVEWLLLTDQGPQS